MNSYGSELATPYAGALPRSPERDTTVANHLRSPHQGATRIFLEWLIPLGFLIKTIAGGSAPAWRARQELILASR